MLTDELANLLWYLALSIAAGRQVPLASWLEVIATRPVGTAPVAH